MAGLLRLEFYDKRRLSPRKYVDSIKHAKCDDITPLAPSLGISRNALYWYTFPALLPWDC